MFEAVQVSLPRCVTHTFTPRASARPSPATRFDRAASQKTDATGHAVDDSGTAECGLCGECHAPEDCRRCEFCADAEGYESPWGRACDECALRLEREAHADDDADDWRLL